MNVRIFWVCAMKCMCAQTRPRFILSSERVLGGMEFEPMLTPREKSPLPENFPRGGLNPQRCGQRAQTPPTSYSGPHAYHSNCTSHTQFTDSKFVQVTHNLLTWNPKGYQGTHAPSMSSSPPFTSMSFSPSLSGSRVSHLDVVIASQHTKMHTHTYTLNKQEE